MFADGYFVSVVQYLGLLDRLVIHGKSSKHTTAPRSQLERRMLACRRLLGLGKHGREEEDVGDDGETKGRKNVKISDIEC